MRLWGLAFVVVGFVGAGLGACVGDSSSPIDASIDATVPPDVTSDSPSADGPTGPVNGIVMALDGTPLSIKLDVSGQVVTADATGHFSAPDPGPTYAIRFHYSDLNIPVQVFTIYRNLTRRDPVLMMPLHYGFSSALVSGNVAGAPPTSPTLWGRLVFAPKTVVGANTAYGAPVIGDAGAYGPTQIFFPNTSQSGTLYFFEKSLDDGGNVTGYSSLAQSANVGLAADAGITHSFGSVTSISTGAVSGSVSLPVAGSWTTATTQLLGVFGGNTPVPIDSTGSTAFDFVAPNINNMKLTVAATATSGSSATSAAWKTGITVNTSGIALSLPRSPTVTSPAPNATVALASTPFVVTDVQGIAYLTLMCTGPGSDGGSNSINYIVHMLTDGNGLIAPVDALLSLALPPSGSTCTFVAASMTGFTTVDSAAGPTGITSSFSPDFAAGDGSFAQSAPLVVTAQ